MMKKIRYILPGVGILALAVVGTITHNVPLLYTTIIAICVIAVLVALSKIKEGYYPYLLYGIGLGMVLMTTLAGPYLIGSDVHLDYYYAQLYSGGDVWVPLRATLQETSIGNTIFAPLIPLPLMWVFKVVQPMFYAITPVLLYYIFKKWTSTKGAFLASLIFIIVPPFFKEVATIPREMVSETFLAMTLFLIFVSGFRLRYRIPAITTCGMLTIMTHYSIGIILLTLLGLGLIVKLILKIKEGLSARYMAVILIVLLTGSFIYFSISAEGLLACKLKGLYNSYVPKVFEVEVIEPPMNLEAPQPCEPVFFPFGKPPETSPEPTEPATPTNGEPSKPSIWEAPKYDFMMRAALGFDFGETTVPGKLFRILQWMFGLCMLVGLFLLRRNKEYWVLASGLVLILLLCLHPEGFSKILSASRFYHIALFALALPTFIGAKSIFRKPVILVLCLLIPYFLFTSGFIFEVTKCEDITKKHIPCGIALSNYRLDLGATVTENDIKVRDWIVKNKTTFPIYSDLVGYQLLEEKIGQRYGISTYFPTSPVGMIEPPFYIFVRERNVWDGKLVIAAGWECRKYVTIEKWCEKWDVDINKNIIYQAGDAKVLEVK